MKITSFCNFPLVPPALIRIYWEIWIKLLCFVTLDCFTEILTIFACSHWVTPGDWASQKELHTEKEKQTESKSSLKQGIKNKVLCEKSQIICKTRAGISKFLFRLWRPVIPGSDHSNSDKSQEKIIAEIKRRLEKKPPKKSEKGKSRFCEKSREIRETRAGISKLWRPMIPWSDHGIFPCTNFIGLHKRPSRTIPKLQCLPEVFKANWPVLFVWTC